MPAPETTHSMPTKQLKQQPSILLPAKVTRPAVLNIYQRERLFRVLDSHRRHKAVWVAGMPGAGKTTFISSYIESRRLHSLWYRVDAGDNDLSTFFHYIGLAAHGLDGRKHRQLLHLTPEYRPGVETFTLRFFNQLYGLMPRPSLLVLDNYHEIQADSEMHKALLCAVENVPEGVSIIIISRDEPPRPFARCLTNRDMTTIGWNDLRLTEAEADGIAKVLGGREYSPGAISRLHARTAGWTAGLVLMVERFSAGIVKDHEENRTAKESVFNYFMEEIFQKTDPEVMGFLMQTAFLTWMTAGMARDISGNKDAGRILAGLDSRHFFIEKRTLRHDTYQYHPLFREFLIGRAHEVMKPATISGLKLRSARLLSEAGELDDAARLYKEAGDWGGLTSLILSNSKALIDQGRLQTLDGWLASIPERAMLREPWLLYYMGLCRLPFNQPLARRSLKSAFDIFKKKRDAPGTFLSWIGAVNSYLYEMENLQPLDHWIQEFERLLRRHNGFPSETIGEQATPAMFSAMMFRQPQHRGISRWQAATESVMLKTSNRTLKMSIGYNLALHYLRTGYVAKAGILIDMFSSHYGSPVVSHLQRLMWLRVKALYEHFVSLYKKSLGTVEEGLHIAGETGISIFNQIFFGLGVYNSLSLGDLKNARLYLDKLSSMMERSSRRFDVIYYHRVAALVALNTGDMATAVEHAAACVKISEELGAPHIHNIHEATLAYVLAEAGRHREALRLTGKVRKLSRRMESVLFPYACSLTEAIIFLYRGEDKLCVESLAKAVEIGKGYGIRVPLFIRPSSFASLCAKALEAGIEVEYIQKLIRLNGLTPPQSMESVEQWPWDIRIYTLGGFKIIANGQKAGQPGRGGQKTISLLKALIAFGSVEVSRSRLIDKLWPDSDGDMGLQTFKTTLHRLRRMLKSDRSLVISEGTLSLDPRYCWVDLWSFEKLLSQSEPNEGLDIRRMEKAIGLYKGPFLEGTEEQWVIPVRERLRDKFIRYTTVLGCYYEVKEEFDKAIEVYRKGIEVEDLKETFYQRLMLCYKHKGDKREALRLYALLSKALSEINQKPSRETEVVCRSLS